MTTSIILDLNDLCRLVSGGEVKCKAGDKNIILSTESDVIKKISMIFRNIGQMDDGHRVSVDGREYIDRIVFQTHLEEQVLYNMMEKKNESKETD